MISPSGRSTEIADIGREKIIVDWVIPGMRRAKTPTDIRRRDRNWTKVIVGIVRDKCGITRVLIGYMASVTTGLVRSRKDGCRHGWRASWQAENTRLRRGGGGESQARV